MIFISSTSAVFPKGDDLLKVRKYYYLAIKSEEKFKEFENILVKYSNPENTILGYIGMSFMLKAKYAWLPNYKIEYFTKGKNFLELAISKDSNNDRLNVKWIDVGDVADWGYPISFEKKQNFVKYANWFWNLGLKPDLVVIDGRFRILCFLTTIKFATTGTKIIFDDYTNRPFYHIVEEFLKIKDTCGRQALFEVDKRSKKLIDESVISEFKNVIG